ncbi:MAG: putative zinc-binding metallopeptidase [Woeseiaceae bacterium]|nr:putative zinc-binding metallopeptidase [Woeseiaceae bacterium]
MRRLSCRCGQAVFFDNYRCAVCTRRLGFDPEALAMRAEEEPGSGLPFCGNREGPSRCNWLLEPGMSEGTCVSCRTSKVIPTLSKPKNRDRWRKLEAAKRRLIYDLLRLGLPVDASRLRFVFKEDRRTNPDVHEEHVAIGHREGVITINAAEADEVYRERMRVQMNEPYRTLLGHVRHESGHYYFGVILDEAGRAAARAAFGDERSGYDAALRRHYSNGPLPGWESRFITSYASAHPVEDWAETWAHYLHICAVLETAAANELIKPVDGDDWQARFIDLIVKVNEILRAMGLADAYPFVITDIIAEKIGFVHAAIGRFTGRRDAPWSPAD